MFEQNYISKNPLYSDGIFLYREKQQGWDWPYYIVRGHRSAFPNSDFFLFLWIVFTIANSVDPDEMPHHVAFHLGIHCLSKYLLRGIQYTKG